MQLSPTARELRVGVAIQGVTVAIAGLSEIVEIAEVQKLTKVQLGSFLLSAFLMSVAVTNDLQIEGVLRPEIATVLKQSLRLQYAPLLRFS